jgi:8-oxo-dGTP diphosphatase
MREPIHVVAGVLSDPYGRVLLTQRSEGKHLPGMWEFPGGKCEAGEAPQDALRRELREELGVEAGSLERLIAVPWHYLEKSIFLDVSRVLDYTGHAHGREGQALRWVSIDELAQVEMPAADRPVVTALCLPRRYIITPEPAGDAAQFLRQLAVALASVDKFVQLRSKHLVGADLRLLAIRARDAARHAGATMLLNGHLDLVRELDLDGIHLPASELLHCTSRPLAANRWVGASCHDERELAHAVAIDADFVALAPVNTTSSHAGVAALGWPRFTQLCEKVPVPVYALGGLSMSDLSRAIAAGAQGIAGISALWPKTQSG